MTARAGADGRPRRRWATPTRRRGSPVDREHREPPPQVARDGGGREDGRPVAVEGQRGDQAHAVELHGGPQHDAGGPGGGVDLGPQRGARRRQEELQLGQALNGDGRTPGPRKCPGGSTATRSSSKSWAAMISSPLSGKVTTARSSWPEASCCSSWTLEPSATFRWMWGWRTRSRSKSWGTSQRPVVPIMPRRTVPTTSSRRAVTSETMASSSFITWRARVDDDLALLGQAARGPVDQLHVELALQPGHVRRDVGLHRADGRGGGREAARVGDAQECLQVFQFHGPASPGNACRSCAVSSL